MLKDKFKFKKVLLLSHEFIKKQIIEQTQYLQFAQREEQYVNRTQVANSNQKEILNVE